MGAAVTAGARALQKRLSHSPGACALTAPGPVLHQCACAALVLWGGEASVTAGAHAQTYRLLDQYLASGSAPSLAPPGAPV